MSRAPGRGAMDCLPGRRGAPAALELAETFHKTPALVAYTVRCGKPGCRCNGGAGHGPYWFLRWREGATQRRRYVKQADLAAVRSALKRRRAADRAERLARLLALDGLREVEAWLRSVGSPSSPSSRSRR